MDKFTDRDKLIELIEEWHKEAPTQYLADHLLANGVIVPPIKVGQTVYVINCDEGDVWIDEFKVKYFYCSSKGVNRFYIECGTMGNNFRPKDIGKDVFLTKEEAEEELKRRSEGNAKPTYRKV